MNLNLAKSKVSFIVREGFTRQKGGIQSPFRYPGGKYYALKYIIPLLNCVPHDEYREPFVGGGSIFFGKPKGEINWINDLEPDLVETYLAIADNARCKILSNRVSVEKATPENHANIKKYNPQDRDDVAFRTFFLNRTSYSGILNKPSWGYKSGNSSPPENWPRLLVGANKKLENTKITCLDFEEVINATSSNTVLLYLDPPYYHADQKRAYTKPFELFDHERLKECLRNTNHYFCLSYDDCPEIREQYKWANIYERSWFYNTANSSGPRIIGNELLITNYEAICEPQLTLF